DESATSATRASLLWPPAVARRANRAAPCFVHYESAAFFLPRGTAFRRSFSCVLSFLRPPSRPHSPPRPLSRRITRSAPSRRQRKRFIRPALKSAETAAPPTRAPLAPALQVISPAPFPIAITKWRACC